MKDEWAPEEITKAVRDNVLMTWGSNNARHSLPILVRGEGVYLYDDSGKQFMDLTSQAVCANMGYTVDDDTVNAIFKQMKELVYVYPGMGMCPVRARLCNLMAEVTPGDINGFVFPTGGSEANEGAIRIARRFSGKYKIMSSMRSYHGGTTGPLAATGDFRSQFGGQQPGFVKIFHPHPQTFSLGDTDSDAAELALNLLEEQIVSEGPDTIAAIMLETIVGSNGVLLHPVGYLEGVRALCDRYDVLMILDEVMSGFWRTGPLFAFQHFEGVIPDIVTSAKGLTASFLPLGMIGVRQKIQDHFENVALGWGSTYTNHPVSMACAYQVIRKNIRADFPSRVARVEKIMMEEVDSIVKAYDCVLQGRVIGAFGCLDLVRGDGKSINILGQAPSEETQLVKESMLRNGLIGLFRSPMLHICPPLIISEDELRDIFARVRQVLDDLKVGSSRIPPI